VFEPVFQISPATAKALMRIEATRHAFESLPVSVRLLAALRETARIESTHRSTQIEGNRLTEAEVRTALLGGLFPGRERDVTEVRNYYRALEALEQRAGQGLPLTETDLQRLHGLVLSGSDRPTPYRAGQNVIRDATTGQIVYLPPEAPDVPALMVQLVDWINSRLEDQTLPAPVVAGLAHYQFATIHPYFDGNGRTARLLANLILHLTGYGLKGLYSLEAYYAQNLSGYYAALAVGSSHNYYFGRVEADVSGFIDYFCQGMAEAFSKVEAQARTAATPGASDQSAMLRRLDPRQRRALELFGRLGVVTTDELAAALGLKRETTAKLCRQWLADGFLVLHDASRKNRAYRLAPELTGLMG
jgi:Fic family protein